MCAIAGVVGMILDGPQQEKLLQTMRRRGPDGEGVYQDADCTLLHTRLAIIDPSGGAQPMVYSIGGQKYVITYNGELYNTEELRCELISEGHFFVSHSDTEVLLKAYVQWGTDCLQRLNGIYAFAVWEVHNRKLFLARDRMGVKPLFYSVKGNGFLFASEIKTILAMPGVRARLGREGIAQIMLLGPGRVPGSGVLEGIQELEPGCCAYYSDGKLVTDRYWQLQDGDHTQNFADTVDAVGWLVRDAVRRQMVSDVPIGTFLSGGLDSSIISAICAGALDAPLDTFSVDYLNNSAYFVPGKFQPDSDEQYIRLMAGEIHSRHHETVLTPEDLLQALTDATRARDLPGMADVDFSLLAFCGQIRPHVKVALSGECADEIFGGYPWFRDPEIRDADGFPWSQNNAYRRTFLSQPWKGCDEYIYQQYSDSIKRCHILEGSDPVEVRIKQMMLLNMRWFMQTLLDRKDRMSMYCGLEVRVPFCDHRIAEYLYCVPWSFKEYQGREKGLLRKAMEGLLPDAVLWRKKSPYPKTHDPRYGKLVQAELERVMEGDSPMFSFVRKEALKDLIGQEQQTPWYGQLMRRAQTMAYFLQLDVWLREYDVEIL